MGSMELNEQITGDWQVPVSSLLSEYTPCISLIRHWVRLHWLIRLSRLQLTNIIEERNDRSAVVCNG